jgi:hypothetical protein
MNKFKPVAYPRHVLHVHKPPFAEILKNGLERLFAEGLASCLRANQRDRTNVLRMV